MTCWRCGCPLGSCAPWCSDGKLAPLAGVRLRSDVNDEIASENRAISRIEEAIDNYVPSTCAFCTATATDSCSLCDRPMCESDAIAEGICIECDAELL